MRQTERLKLFEMAFANMPLWETRTTEDGKLSATYQMIDGQLKLVEVSATRYHVKMIPRRVRRDMARKLSKRQWQTR